MDTIAETIRQALIQAARDAYQPESREVARCEKCGYGFREGEDQSCDEDCA